MTKEEALQKIEELKAFIEQEDNKPWKPENHQNYYYVNVDGYIRKTFYAKDARIDENRVKTGNCFKTEEEAKKSFKYWAMNEAEYEYSFPFAPDTWFDDYEGSIGFIVWDEEISDWNENIKISSYNDYKHASIARRKRK